MSNFNVALSECISSLYDYSENCKVSIELIQKLAHQLKLETFIDKLGYTVNNAGKSLDNNQKTERLSIAGSSILIDIDFVSDNKIVGVSLSSGVSEDYGNTTSGESYISEKRQAENGITVVELDLSKNPFQFLGSKDEEKPKADIILLQNLTAETLNKFPSNLRYLANIDKLSSSSINLFSMTESIALLLHAISELEGVKSDNSQVEDDSNWLVTEGYTSSVGRIVLNDVKNSQLGLFSIFWKDNRYINHEYQKDVISNDNLLVGKEYKALLSIEASGNEVSQTNYFSDLEQSEWNLLSYESGSGNYIFKANDPSIVLAQTNAASSNSTVASQAPFSSGSLPSSWSIYFNTNHAIYVPKYFIEYLGLTNHKLINKLNIDSTLEKIFETLNKGSSIDQNISFNTGDVNLKVSSEISGPKFVPVDSIAINKLVEIHTLIPVLRNFLFLSNLLRTLANGEIISAKAPMRSRRGSKVSGVAAVAANGGQEAEKELSEETKKKLKNSLKLSCDVTDEELLGLNAVTETASFSTIQPQKSHEIDLDSFLSNDNDKDNEGDELMSGEKESVFNEPFLNVDFQHIDLNSKNYDLIFRVEGRINTEELSTRLVISNGVAKEYIKQQEGEDMEVDGHAKMAKFVKVLNLTEDLVKAFRVVYD